ncbi:hypothetical protein JCM10296v2_001269 [Rhodotorula toruloides]
MSLASLVPSIVIDPFHTPILLPPGVIKTMILPYCEEYTGVAPTRTDSPPWTAALEVYHQTIHPLVWANVGEDDIADRSALAALGVQIAGFGNEKARPSTENSPSLDDLETAYRIVEQRREYRWTALLGIHVARTKYINHQLRTTSAFSVSEVLAALPNQGAFTPPVAEPHSVWPIFALPPPLLDASRLVTLWNCDDWSRFTFPAPPPVANSAAAFATEKDSPDTSHTVKPCSSAANATLETASWTAPVFSTPAYELRRRHSQKAQRCNVYALLSARQFPVADAVLLLGGVVSTK